VDRVHGLWTVQEWPVHGGLATGHGGALIGARLAGAAEPGSLPQVGEKGEELWGSSPRALVADSTAR
jgi:hypothetical protein